ncbi:MAG: carboxypeptidase-like regulatory domain-containing protein [Acidobacteriia bacterium]|nr:carboxypeptidase-like regulatory domain-containing protein [Terriglobia bacterium]
MRRSTLLLLLLVTLVVAALPSAGAGTGTIAGTVLDVHGKPVADATVTLQTADGRHPTTETTNAQGRFFFPQLAHGYYDVRAYHNGAWSPWKHNIEVVTGKQTEVTLHLATARKKPA